MGTVNQTVHTVRLSLEFIFVCFLGFMIYLYVFAGFFYRAQLSHFPSYIWCWRNKLKWAPFKFLLPPHYCGLEAGSIPS